MFHKFLNSLKRPGNESLIEAIQQGYSVLFEEVFRPEQLKGILSEYNNNNFQFYKILYKQRKQEVIAKFKMSLGVDINTFREDMKRIASKAGLKFKKINKVNNLGKSDDMMLVYFDRISLIESLIL